MEFNESVGNGNITPLKFVDLLGEGQLHENTVDLGIVVQFADNLFYFGLGALR